MPDQPTTTVYTANSTPEPTNDGPSADRRYVINVLDGKVYAVAFNGGWKPTHRIGPFIGEQLATDASGQDWSNPTPCRDWNVRLLVNLCDNERQRMIQGIGRLSRAKNATGLQPMRPRVINASNPTDKQAVNEVRNMATQGDETD